MEQEGERQRPQKDGSLSLSACTDNENTEIVLQRRDLAPKSCYDVQPFMSVHVHPGDELQIDRGQISGREDVGNIKAAIVDIRKI